MSDIKTAVILAGGLGTRLKPYTHVFPKPMMPVGEYCILEIIIRQLSKFGIKKIILAVNHQADLIKSFFGNGDRWEVDISYSLEKIALRTVGPLKLIEGLPENFLFMNGDILTDLNFKSFYEEHCNSNANFTIKASERQQKIDYGVLGVDQNNNLVTFKEKPVENYYVSMGIYMINKDVLNFVPPNTPIGFDDLMLENLRKKLFTVKISKHNGFWLDIGRPDDYAFASEKFEELRDTFL